MFRWMMRSSPSLQGRRGRSEIKVKIFNTEDTRIRKGSDFWYERNGFDPG